MTDGEAHRYYLSMLNVMAGLQDDLGANDAPETAKALLIELLEECRSDCRVRFGTDSSP